METPPFDQEPLPVRRAGAAAGVLGRLDRCITFMTRILFAVAGLGLVAMLLLVVADVIGIKVLARPVPGGIELVAFLAVVAIAFAVARTQVMRGHVAVDFIIEKFPRRAKLVIDALMILLGVLLFVLLSYYSFDYAAKLKETGEVSMTQRIPFYPFVYAMGACFVVTMLVLISDLIKSMAKAVKQWNR